jgi:hypothetical protein
MDYMDVSIAVSCGRHIVDKQEYMYWISGAPNDVDFAGYVYEINGKERIRPRLLFDSMPDGTFRLRVPKAVRYVKEAK